MYSIWLCIVIQHFVVAKGKGGNGKSVINSLMMRTVGNYGYKLPSSAVSQAMKGDAANPSIANLANMRWVVKDHICEGSYPAV